MSNEQYGCRGCGPVPINHRPAITDDRFFYTYEGDRPVMWCPSCWAMPPDLAALLRSVDAGEDGAQGALADWLEEHGDRRAGRVRAMKPATTRAYRLRSYAGPTPSGGFMMGDGAEVVERPETDAEFRARVLALFPPTWRA